MRWIAAVALLSGCAEGLAPNARGEYDLGDGYVLTITSTSGDGRCDLFSQRDHELAPEDQPGFCVCRGEITGPEPRWLLYRDDSNAILPEYHDQGIVLTYAGSEYGDFTNIKLTDVASGGGKPMELVWGHEDDPSTWTSTVVRVRARRFR